MSIWSNFLLVFRKETLSHFKMESSNQIWRHSFHTFLNLFTILSNIFFNDLNDEMHKCIIYLARNQLFLQNIEEKRWKILSKVNRSNYEKSNSGTTSIRIVNSITFYFNYLFATCHRSYMNQYYYFCVLKNFLISVCVRTYFFQSNSV